MLKDIKTLEKEINTMKKIQKITDVIFGAVIAAGLVALIGVMTYATMFGNLAQYIR